MKQWLTFSWCVLLAAMGNVALAQRNLKDIPDPDPEIERQSFVVADGFEVNLFAADPQIAKPIQMNFDPQGRLWIASSEIYPQIKPGEKANDRILVLEDTDGDGKSDKTSVFASGLLIPTGVAPGDGGVYVANSTELLHFKDTDGDGKADQERVVLSGFGTEDTHHILHTLKWGPDGMLYLNQSIYIHSHIETPWGVRRLNAGGIWQLRTENLKLEVFARGWVNTWGHIFDAYGQSFATDGAGGEGINYAIPGAAYPTAQGVPKIFHGLNPGSPKMCGLEIVSGRHLPDDWQGNLITNDFRGHRVCRFVLSDAGSGFAAKEQIELIKTSHGAFRPIDMQMGPDGAIYIADWYNPIIQHGEVDFRDPRRDHTHGRIWRVSRKDRKPVARINLAKAAVPELLEQLMVPEGWTRLNAKRVLKERGAPAVLPELAAWTKKLDRNDPLFERHQLEALWTYQSLDVPNAELLASLLRAAKPEVRAAAVRVLQHWSDRVPGAIESLSECIKDESPRVRLEAVRVLGNVGGARGVELALQALALPMDQFLDYALWLTAWENKDKWLPLAESGQMTFGGNVDQMTFALKAVGSPAVAPRLLALISANKLEGQQLLDAVLLIASLGSADDLRKLFDRAIAAETPAEQRAALLRTLVSASQQRDLKPTGDLSAIATRLDAQNPIAVRAVAAEAIGVWKLSAQAAALDALAAKADEDVSVRKAAMAGLARLGASDAVTKLTALAATAGPIEVREAAVIGASSLDAAAGSKAAVALLSSAPATTDPTPLVNAFLGVKGGPQALTASLKDAKLNGDVVKLAVRAIESSGRKLPELTAAFTTAGGVQAGPKTLTPAELAALLDEVKSKGDAARGELVFRKAANACLNCHAIGGAGGRVGPDLASIGGSAQPDYLVESLLEPSKKIKEGFNTLVIVTHDGRSVSGVKVRQTDKDLVLRNAEDKEFSIPLKEIDEQADGLSLMPAGLTEKLTRGELVDLVRFLSELGKVGDYQISRKRVVRRWQSLLHTEESFTRIRRNRIGATAEDSADFTWNSSYSTVRGVLPVADLPVIPFKGPFQDLPDGISVLRAEFDVSTAGSTLIDLGETTGLSMWLDSTPLESSGPQKLTVGRHRLTIVIDRAKRTTPIRVELKDPPTDAAQVQLVTGK